MHSSTLHYVTRDGEKVSPYFLTDDAAFAWLLRHQGMSVSWATEHEGYAFTTATDIAPWSPEEQQEQRRYKTGVWNHEHGSVTGTRQQRNLVRANCSACVLGGYRDVYDDESPTDAPNYAGWARVYVETRHVVPHGFVRGFERDLNEDSPYGAALRRDVVTYGVHVADQP